MEVFAKDMKNLPLVVNTRLRELKRLDQKSINAVETITNEEKALFEELTLLSKSSDPDFDEIPLVKKFQDLLNRRHQVLHSSDDKIQKALKLYSLIDERMKFIDTYSKDHLVATQFSGEIGLGNRKKKKRKVNRNNLSTNQSIGEDLDGMEGVKVLPHIDPNEPLYCTCRQFSFGCMIACENPDCRIEWFHFDCVGLKIEPKEPWFCSECR